MYNEESVVAHLRAALTQFLSQVRGEAEVILVNDGSKDRTLSAIAAWAYEDPRGKGQFIPQLRPSECNKRRVGLCLGHQYAPRG